MIEEISNALQAKLTAMEFEGSPFFKTVIPHPPTSETGGDFEGFPSASHYYEVTDSDYSTVEENRRNYNFSIYLIAVWQNKTVAEQYPLMYKYVDALMDMLDKSGDLGINDIIVRPAPAEFTRVTLEQGKGLMGRVRLVCAYDAPNY